MLGIYFSGTGNTRYCLKTFLDALGGGAAAIPIEDKRLPEQLERHEIIVLAYPVYFSGLPKIVRDFLVKHGETFRDKKVYIIATMGLFSGDGAGCAARLLKRHGARILGGLHLKMPDCIADEKALKRSLKENRRLVRQAQEKITCAARAFQSGAPTRDGLSLPCHLAGLFGQRLWFGRKTAAYTNKLKIDPQRCVGCAACVQGCPMKNLRLAGGKAVQQGSCTMCYRCISVCPRQAITLLGKRVVEQSRIEKYL